jgi:hypothetical protein
MVETVIPCDFYPQYHSIMIEIPPGYGASTGKTMEIRCERFKPGAAVAIPVPRVRPYTHRPPRHPHAF